MIEKLSCAHVRLYESSELYVTCCKWLKKEKWWFVLVVDH
jgi:hypothetical protein